MVLTLNHQFSHGDRLSPFVLTFANMVLSITTSCPGGLATIFEVDRRTTLSSVYLYKLAVVKFVKDLFNSNVNRNRSREKKSYAHQASCHSY